MKELKNNVNTLLWLMVTLSAMVVFLTLSLSSCNSSVQNGKGSKTPDDPPVPKITVTYSCSDNNGTIEAKVISSKEGKIEGNKIIKLVSGDKIQFTAKPSDGYKFKGWVPATLGNKETFELTVDKDLSVSVEFEKDLSTMTELEFLDYKIGFDRNKKEKSDVIYGTDSIYKSDQLYKTNNLGFGKKAEDLGIYYHGLTGSSIKAMNVAEVEETSSSFKEKGVKTNFGSVYDGLEVRWKSAKACMSGKWNKYTDANYDNLFLCRPYLNDFKFLLYPDSKGYNLYIKINESSYDSYYMDFHIAFVKKDEPDKGYSVHFSNLNDKKDYEPYLLFDAGDARYKDYPSEAIPQYTDQKDGIHMFRLSSLLKTSLKHQREKESKKWKYSDDVLVNRLLEEVKSKNYDIYLILGHVNTNKTSGYEGFFSILRGRFWCNVLKFGDPIWAENQTQP